MSSLTDSSSTEDEMKAGGNQVATLSEMLDLPIGDHGLTQLNTYFNAQFLEAYRRGVIDATGGYGYSMPMKSMRTRNTAFKLYAVKFFNSKIKERRQRLLGTQVIGLVPPDSGANND